MSDGGFAIRCKNLQCHPSPPLHQWLLKYDELKWEMGVKKTEAVELLLKEEKIENVSLAYVAATLSTQ